MADWKIWVGDVRGQYIDHLTVKILRVINCQLCKVKCSG